jgi:hypothetical protein
LHSELRAQELEDRQRIDAVADGIKSVYDELLACLYGSSKSHPETVEKLNDFIGPINIVYSCIMAASHFESPNAEEARFVHVEGPRETFSA